MEDSRVIVPISDDSAHMPVYANYLISQKRIVKPVIETLVKEWPTEQK